MPGTISGHATLGDADGGSEWSVDGTVTVQLPLIGGKIEQLVADQVVALLSAETAFTERWLASREDGASA